MPSDGGALKLLGSVAEFLESAYRDIDAARSRVFVEMYIYRDDRLGREFSDHLEAAVKRGVDVRLLHDRLGSKETHPRFFDKLRGRGINVRAYGPYSWVRGPRNHSRMVIADGAAYTGGVNIGDEWLPPSRGGRGWHDVCVRLEGAGVEEFAAVYEHRWAEAMDGGPAPHDFDTEHRYDDIRLVADSPRRDSLVFLHHVEAFRRARRRIWLCNAYFLPSPKMIEALWAAAARGVDVRLIVPGASDLPIIARAARSRYRNWLEGGIKILEYLPTVMHAKYSVIDDAWCSVGTFNANPTSLGLANELNLFVFRPDFVAEVARRFLADQGACSLIDEEALRNRGMIARLVDELADSAMSVTELIWGAG